MTRKEMLQYAEDNYSFGDTISRSKFVSNNDTTIIKSTKTGDPNNIPHFFGGCDSIFLGRTQIYCGESRTWATNLTKESFPQYEIY